MVNIYNHLMGLSYKKYVAKFNIGSNTYPSTVSETKTITLTKIVQVKLTKLLFSMMVAAV